MINPKHNPVEWALLVDELREALEHLGALISKLGSASEYDEEWFRVDMLAALRARYLLSPHAAVWAKSCCTERPRPLGIGRDALGARPSEGDGGSTAMRAQWKKQRGAYAPMCAFFD